MDLTNKYLDIWNSNQPQQETTFSWMINSLCDGRQCDDGMERIILSYEHQNGDSRDRNAIDSYLQDSIKEMETTYGIAVLIFSMRGKDTTVRSIDNSSICGLSKNEVIQLCLMKFDNGHRKVNIFVTTDSSRSRCIDVTFTNPVITILNKLDSISRAWVASERNNNCVSKMWRAQLQSFYDNDPHRFELSSDDMFLSSNSMMIILGTTGRNNIPLFHPIVQIVFMKRLPNVAEERWRIAISDGSEYYQGIVPESLNHHIHSGELKLHSVIRVLDFATYETANGFNVFILLQFQFLYHHRYSIGYPINVCN